MFPELAAYLDAMDAAVLVLAAPDHPVRSVDLEAALGRLAEARTAYRRAAGTGPI